MTRKRKNVNYNISPDVTLHNKYMMFNDNINIYNIVLYVF